MNPTIQVRDKHLKERDSSTALNFLIETDIQREADLNFYNIALDGTEYDEETYYPYPIFK